MTTPARKMNTVRRGRTPLNFATGLLLGIAGLVFILSVPPLAFAAPKAEFSILYTNDVMGEVEPCG